MLCDCVSWCEQDLMPVYHGHCNGSYASAVADSEYDLVFAGHKPASKL